MAARSIGSGTIHLGLVAIPVKLYTAQSPKSVSFNLLHASCKSRLKQQMLCPVHNVAVERGECVKAFEFARDQYVTFTDDELKALESVQAGAIHISECVPVATLDPVVVEKSYYLGPDKGGDQAYRLIATALAGAELAAVGTFAKRGKDALVAIRAHAGPRAGLTLHECLYADEVRPFDDVETGAQFVLGETEQALAGRLVQQLRRERFDASRFADSWAARVHAAVDRKVAGEEFVVPETLPGTKMLDLLDALRGSIVTDSKGRPGPVRASARSPKPRVRKAG